MINEGDGDYENCNPEVYDGGGTCFYWELWYIVPLAGKYVEKNEPNAESFIRPVFYLSSEIKISGGKGTISDPFIVKK